MVQLLPTVLITEELEDDLITWCRERVSSIKVPKSIEFRSHLPRTPAGKLQKYQLRAPYWENVEKYI